MAEPTPNGRAVIVIHQMEGGWRATTSLPPEGIWQRVSSNDFPTNEAATAYTSGATIHTGAMNGIIGMLQ